MTGTLYYAELDSEVFGPYSIDTLRGMHLTPDVQILSTDTNLWRPAEDVPELRSSLDYTDYSPSNPLPPTPVPRMDADLISAPAFNERSIFYVMRGGNPYGPYTLDALMSVAMSEDTQVSLDGMVTWHRAVDIPGLIDTLAAGAEAPSPTPADEPELSMAEKKQIVGNIIKGIFAISDKDITPYRRVFDSTDEELKFYVDEYNHRFDEILRKISEIISLHRSDPLNANLLTLTIDSLNTAIKKFDDRYMDEFMRLERRGVAAPARTVNNPDSPPENSSLASVFCLGSSKVSFEPPFADVEMEKRLFVETLSDNPMLITYNDEGQRNAEDFIDSVAAHLLQANTPRSVGITVIDLEELSGLSSAFKTLNRDIYKVVSDFTLARDIIRDTQTHVGNVIRNLLVLPRMTLRSYNTSHDSQEPHQLLIVKSFPSSLSGDALNSLRLIANNGPRAGVHLVIMMSQSSVVAWGTNSRINDDFNLDEFRAKADCYSFLNDRNQALDAFLNEDFGEAGYRVTVRKYRAESLAHIRDIVDSVNAQCELREDVVLPLADYLQPSRMWWTADSSRMIDVPFGLSSDRNVAGLKITQESGQNTAVVIGIPGSGKSVFLHSLILNAAFKYSPDELRMYLIDFSGVEFNTYALGQLPHARVIAPEAEREFGISILRELEEEGSRRMTLCRDYNVNSIVELRRVAPDLKVPRLLVIIDEFQKLFDDSNDKLSQEANAKIHIIIQEFRKFGINLVLATQKLPANAMLPRDLIANRVVFKCTPGDFQSLITMENSREVPRLRTGECIYNSESGASYDNVRVQGFFASKQEIDRLLAQLHTFQESKTYTREPMMVFRSGEQPLFINRRRRPEHIDKAIIPARVPIYVGESIAVSDTDVCVELVKENYNNLLVIGGESAVAQRIAFNSVLSAISAHESDTASVFVINGMRDDNPLWDEVNSTLAKADVTYASAQKEDEIVKMLTYFKDEVESRRSDDTATQPHIYIAIFDAQGVRAFDPDTSSAFPKPSAAAKLMAYLMDKGPSVGVFTIIQTDTLAGISRIDQKALEMCNYRVALQMPEAASMKVMDSYAANKLFVFNRPSSIFRAYMRDNSRNTSIKFKPYK